MRERRRSAAEWLAALQGHGITLRRSGAAEWVGPCLLCRRDRGSGGRDRFHLVDRAPAPPLVGCRQCIDGQPDGRARFGELARLLWPDSPAAAADPRQNRPRSRPESANSTPPPVGESTKPSQRDTGALRRARRVWEASEDLAPGIGPAWSYLVARRRVWPPATVARALGAAGERPVSVRVLSAEAAAHARRPLPAGAVEALVFAYTAAPAAEAGEPGDVGAVQLEALDRSAAPRTSWPGIEAPAKRLTLGRLAGGWFRVAPRSAPGAGALVVAEGPLDALAGAWLWPRCETRAAGGSLARLQPGDVAGAARVILAPDNDGAGLRAGAAVLEALGAASIPAALWRPESAGADPVTALGDTLAAAAPGEIPARQWSEFLTLTLENDRA